MPAREPVKKLPAAGLCAWLGPQPALLLRGAQESRTYWFNPATLEAEAEFLLLGLVVGLAIYNGVLLDFPLPLALYRKILGQEVKLRDLEDMQPTLGRWVVHGRVLWAGVGALSCRLKCRLACTTGPKQHCRLCSRAALRAGLAGPAAPP